MQPRWQRRLPVRGEDARLLPARMTNEGRSSLRLAALTAATLLVVLLAAGASRPALTAARALGWPHPAVSIQYRAPGNPVRIGDAVHFSAARGAGRDLRYTWDMGDGTVAEGQQVAHTYGQYGTYIVQVWATDSIGQQTKTDLTLAVLPAPPHAVFSFAVPDATYPLGIQFDASGSTGTELSYQWDFGDGAQDQGGQDQSSQRPYHTYPNTGTFVVKLTVQDPTGQQDSASQAVKITVPQPQASFSTHVTPPSSSGEFGHVAFDASQSSGIKLTYQWDFGDGSGDSGPTPKHTYNSVGSYTVKLVVTDLVGQQSTTTQQVDISVPQPQATFSVTTGANAHASFDAKRSSGIGITYTWDFGDGSIWQAGTYPLTAHDYPTAGQYTVVLTVTDVIGQQSIYSKVITV